MEAATFREQRDRGQRGQREPDYLFPICGDPRQEPRLTGKPQLRPRSLDATHSRK